MRRFAWTMGVWAVLFLLLAPIAVAAEPPAAGEHVIVSVNGDTDLPAGTTASAVVVVKGDATIEGQIRTLVVVDGSAVLTGARAETIVAVRSQVELGPGTVVSGEVRTLDSSVNQAGDAVVTGGVRDVSADLFALGAVLAPAIMLFAFGFAVAAIVAGLVLAALASRQVRAAETLISRQPLLTVGVGLLAVIVLPILAILAMVTVVGAPLGLAILFGVLPVTAFIGYLVAAIWIGDWIVARLSPAVVRERPYLAAVVGIAVLWVASIVPFLTAIASLVGFGAVILLAWRVFRGEGMGSQPVSRAAPAPIGA